IFGTNIRYAVLIRGIPLKVRSDLPPPASGEQRDPLKDRDEASVDSEIAVLGLDNPWRGPLNNPYFQAQEEATQTKSIPPPMLLVSRLDGAPEDILKTRINDSLRSEARGLWGWAYLDLRGIQTGPYAQGDQWLQNCSIALRKNGIPILTDFQEPTFPDGFPVRDAALYLGWYAGQACGPFADPQTTFSPGAIAIHIHSFSAATLRQPIGWVAPLVQLGAAVSAGNVYEPYLSLCLNLDLFVQRLLAGWPIADAAWASTPVLSWMSIIIADPLYRPFAAWHRPQPRRDAPANEWERFRQTVTERNGNMEMAAPTLVALSKLLFNPMLAEAVGVWRFENGQQKQAAEILANSLQYAKQPWQRVQIAWYLIQALEASQKKHEAIRLINDLLKQPLAPNQVQLLQSELNRLNPTSSPTPKNSN
ncbi:MAG: TIGR03790 family protein, partial [Chthoniobacterales bacterium]|nr:TIGR03790 family protein [Chthoniobacterales bacterium]